MSQALADLARASGQANLVISSISLVAIVALATAIIRKGTAFNNATTVLVLNLLFADLLEASVSQLSWYWIVNGSPTAGPLCSLSGAWLNLADVSSTLWVFVIAVHTYFLAVHGIRFKHVIKVSMSIVWTFSLFVSLIGFALQKPEAPFYDNVGSWCWISDSYPVERIVFHYAWIIFVAFAISVIYGIILLHVRKHGNIWGKHNEASKARLSSAARKLFWYPLAYLFLTSLLVVYRISEYFGVELPVMVLVVAAGTFNSLGLVDSLIYGITRNIIRLPRIRGLITTLSTGQLRSVTSQSDLTRDELGHTKSGLAIVIERTVDIDERHVEIEMPMRSAAPTLSSDILLDAKSEKGLMEEV